MKKIPKKTIVIPNRSMKEWSTRGLQGYVMLMVEYLKISPSYELARRFRQEKLFKVELKSLPIDFDKVVQTFDDYGDLRTISFHEWWETTGLALYGSSFNKPKVHQIGQIAQDEAFEAGFVKALERYFKKLRPTEGNGPALLLGVPLGMNKRYVLNLVSKAIDQAGVIVTPKAKKAARPLAAERLRSKPLFIGLRLLTFKARFPDKENWRLGVMAEVSPKNAEGLDINAKKNTTFTSDQRINMGILTSRAMKKAQYVAENAARGSFPNSKPIALVDFDWEDILSRLRMSKTIR